MKLMDWMFWLALGCVVYTLIGYPILLWLLSFLRPRPHQRAPIQPTVSVIIAAHNAQSIIADKIQNTLADTYPKETVEIIVGSDGSTDATVEIVQSFADAGVKLVKSDKWIGKHHIQMLARDVAKGEILVFTDTSIQTRPDLLEKIVANFADDTVGSVSSVDELLDAKKSWIGEHFYTYGEMGLRRLESMVGSVVSMSGSLYAVRRAVCDVWHPDQSSDFFVALHTVARGLRAVVDPECRVGLRVVRSEKAEFPRKIRTIVHGLVVLFAHSELLNPARYGLFSWQLLSHKLLRWLLPFFALALLVANVFLVRANLFYQVSLVLQVLGYAMGFLSFAAGRFRSGVFKLASFFVMGNLATLMAWWKFCTGDKMAAWEPSRRE